MMLEGDEDWQTLDVGKFLLYGGAATLLVDLLIYPLELVKTKLQVDAKSKVTIIQAFVNATKKTYASEGIVGLYRGFTLYTVGGLPSQGAYFIGYGFAKDQLCKWNAMQPDNRKLPEIMIPIVAGLLADVVAAPLWTPADVIASRLQIQGVAGAKRYNSTLHAFMHIINAEGYRGLFRGLGASIVTFGPASAIWWATYEACDKRLHEWLYQQKTGNIVDTALPDSANAQETRKPSNEKVWWVAGVSGTVAGAASALLTNPLDIAKTRIQTQHSMLIDYDKAQEKQHRDRLEKELLEKQRRKVAFFTQLRKEREKLAHSARFKGAKAHAMGASMTKTAVLQSRKALHDALNTAVGVRPPAIPSLAITPYQTTLSGNQSIVQAVARATKSLIRTVEGDSIGRKRKAPTAADAIPNTKGPGHYYPRIAKNIDTSMASILKQMWTQEGPASFLRGVFPRIAVSAFASACTFLCYEEVKKASKLEVPSHGELMR